MADTLIPWSQSNQRLLVAALNVVRAELERCAAQAGPADATPPADSERVTAAVAAVTGAQHHFRTVRAANAAQAPPAFQTVRALFGLSPFELDILLMCCGLELDATFGSVCAAAQGDPQRSFATFGLALTAFDGAHWSALTPDAPLRHWHLVDFAPTGGSTSAPLTTRPLRIDERILHFLVGISHLDARLASVMVPVPGTQVLLPIHQQQAQQVASALSAVKPSSTSIASPVELPPLVLLHGADLQSARDIAARACALHNQHLYTLSRHVLPDTMTEIELLARLWEREAVLSHSMLLIEWEDDAGSETAPASEANHGSLIYEFIERIHTGLIVVSRERVRLRHRASLPLEVSTPPIQEQRAVWQTVLEDAAVLGNAALQVTPRFAGQLDRIAAQFSLNAAAIRTAAIQAVRAAGPEHLAEAHANDAFFDRLWDACRDQSRARLSELAQFIQPRATWNDLVLPAAQVEVLHDIVAHVRQQAKVYQTWGFAAKSARGLGISAMFAGSSGTGKTMAAEVLAHELRLDLFRIDLSSVISKYIGETEKNLRRLFDVAETGGAILFFDEADALFGKRSDVKDSHDRYANIEVSYLLQRMESYRGLAILTTNMRNALDTAFLRRIRFITHFPFPDTAQRADIWRRVFPPETPTENLDTDKLAQLNIAGGNIRNVAMNAAFLAAEANEPVRMNHLLRAARAEYAKLEKPLTESETRDWASEEMER